MKQILAATLLALSIPVAAQTASPSDAKTIFEKAKAVSVVVLAGEGAGRLNTVSTGVIVSKDGVILTALHSVKGAAEVQVRTSGGDIYDNVVLVGTDERRDVAALKIPASAFAPLIPGSTTNLAQGDPVYAVTNADGLTWSRLRASCPLYGQLTKSLEQGAVSACCNSPHPSRRVPAAAHSLMETER
jgi:S1-C subfamily serine protease